MLFRSIAPGLRFIRGAALICALTTAGVAGVHASPSDDEVRSRFEHLTVQDGLSHNVVYAIIQDHYGFMWIGTERGLNKYDGNSFTVYEHDPQDSLSISDSRITAILEDADGNIWVGTRWGGLNRFDRETETFERFPSYDCDNEPCSRPDGLNDEFVSSLYEDENGDIWIGTFAGLARLDPDTRRFQHFVHEPGDPRSLPSNKIWCLAGGPTGDLLVGTWNSGMTRLDPESGSMIHYNARQTDASHLSGNRVRSILSDQSGNVWIGISGGGLNLFDPQTSTFTIYRPDPKDPASLADSKVWSLFKDSRGVLWLGTYEAGLARFDRARGAFRHFRHDPDDPESIASDVASVIYEDRSGNLWVGSERGLSIYNLAQERHHHYVHDPGDPNSLAHSEVLALYRHPSNPRVVWIGTNGGGLDRFDLQSRQFLRVGGTSGKPAVLTSDVVTSVTGSADGTLWIGTNGGGLNVLDPKTLTTTAFRYDPNDQTSLCGDAVIDLHVDASGSVWVATDGGGLCRLDPESRSFTRYRHDPFDLTTISDNSVQSIFAGADGTLWIGTVDGGLNRLDPNSDAFKSYRHSPSDPNSLSHNRIASVYQDGSGYVWIGTYGGLNRLDPQTGEVRRYTRDDGLPTEPYFSIQGARDGALWLTAASRLTYFDPGTGIVRHFSDHNGLSPNQYSSGALLLTGGRSLLLGGRNGLSHFLAPIDNKVHDLRPPLVITALKRMDEVVDREIFSNETISLTHADKFFTLEFAVLDYTDPEEHQYQYRLEGYDTDWQRMKGPIGRASYANFNPDRREYTFKVRAANSQGAWNTLQVRLRVIPPWWQTLWFRASAFLAFGLLVGSTAMYRYNRQRRVRRETLQLLTEGRERERQYLARELHDSPLQNLYSMRHKLEVLARDPADPDNKRLLTELHTVVDRTAEDLRVLCGELRPPSLGPFGLEKAIRANIRAIARSHPNLKISLDLAHDGQALPENLRHSLFRIYQSAIGNVLRHADATQMWVIFEMHENRVSLEIQDNGRGFNVPKSFLTLARSQHFGLLGISEWAEAIDAELEVISRPGHGTVVRVRAPRPTTGLLPLS